MTVHQRLHRVLQSPWFHLALIALLALPALWPLLTQGFPKTHDASLHLIRLHLLDEQIGAGNLFPRWLPDLMTGYGYPLFNFYAPLIYYAAEALHLAGLPLPYALSALLGALVIGAGWGMYLLAADLYVRAGVRHRWAGVAAATAYLYTPYLLVNLYVRGAAAELLAQALLPWLFWSTTRVFTAATPLRYVVATSLLLGAVALGHNITLLLLPAVLGAYVLLLLAAAPGDRRDKSRRLAQLSVGALTAAGITAFFWLPLIGERSLLSHSAVNAPVLTEHVWSLTTFLEATLPFKYNVATIPFRLGLVQAVLFIAGLLLTRRRSTLWWYWVILAAICLAGITPLILPIWQRLELLSVVQFPWRLLTFVSLATALMAGGIVTLAQRMRWQVVGAGIVAVLAIFGGRPVIATYDTSMYADLAMDPAIIARYEAGYGAWGAGWHREFLPQWAEQFDAPPVVDGAARPPAHVELRAVTSTGVELAVQQAEPGLLRLNQFYYPGWQAMMDDQPVAVYPSTQQGLVTVDLPAGDHTLRLTWAESSLQTWSEWLSLAAAFTLAGVLALHRRWRWAAAALAGALLLGLLLRAPLRAQDEPVTLTNLAALPGLHLLGYQTAVADNGRSLLIEPIWYSTRQYEDLDLTWRLVDETGSVIAQVGTEPYYGSQPGTRWPRGVVVRDGYRLPLPDGAEPGGYALQFKVDAQTEKTDFVDVGVVSTPPLAAPRPLDVTLTDLQSQERVALTGYTLAANGGAPAPPAATPFTVRPGDLVNLRLFWRAATALSEDYHAFVHLVDQNRQTLVTFDKIPGQESARPRFWDRFYAEPDSYDLRIPADAASGLYTPVVGLYDADDIDRFVYTAADGTVRDAVDLPPIKVVATTAARPQQSTLVRYGDFAELVGFDVAPAAARLRPGDALTVTVYYRGVQPAAVDFTQFFQLHAPALGMAAQADQPPQSGGNPTSTWQPGELIVDQAVLHVAADAQPGEYSLNVGMYDAASGSRAPLAARDGAPLADQQTSLATYSVGE